MNNRLIRAALIKKGFIRPCVPTPLVKLEDGTWAVRLHDYNLDKE